MESIGLKIENGVLVGIGDCEDKDIVIPDGVTSIGEGALRDCTSLTTITIPDSVTEIDYCAFEGCTGLTSITIPDSVSWIFYGVFFGCDNLTTVSVNPNNKVYHSFGNCIINTESKKIIFGCQNSVIPSDGSVTSIDDGAFFACDGLTSITIPDSVISIGKRAFCWCYNLTSIIIPDKVRSIYEETFNGCTSLTSIIIPKTVKYIDYCAFYDCTSLNSVTYTGTMEQWNSIFKDNGWKENAPFTVVHCTDGDVKAE